MDMSRDNDQKGKNLPLKNGQVTMTKKYAYISNEMQPKNPSSAFIHKNKSFPSATSILSCSPTAYDTTASLDNLTCTDYVDFGKHQDKFGQIFWSKNDSKCLDVKHKVSKRDYNNEFWLAQVLTYWESDFNQFMRLRIQLVVAAENFAYEEKLSPVLIPTLPRDTDEQLKLAHKLVDLVDWANRRVGVTLLRYSLDKPEGSYTQVRLLARKTEDEKFQQIVHVNYELEEFIYLLDVMNYIFHKVTTNQPICNVLIKKIISLLFIIFLFIRVKMSWNIGDDKNILLQLKWKLGFYHVLITTS